MSKESGCDDTDPDNHANIELTKIDPDDDSNNLCNCEKSCHSYAWHSRTIHITNGNKNVFVNQHQRNLDNNILVEFTKTSILNYLKVIFVVTENGGFVTQNLFQRPLLKVAMNVAIKPKG